MNNWNLQPLIRDITELGLRSCIIVQNGTTLLEHYRGPRTANELGRINSCTKSILSALICIAIDQGILPEPDTPILEFFPQLNQDNDPRKRHITIAHLLTMSAGFQWNEFGGLNSFPTMTKSEDWVKFVLSQPLIQPPGTMMEYNSGGSQLLASILSQASGQAVAEFAEQQLFRKLGITRYRWDKDPQGIHTGGFGLYLKPRDMAKLGLLYLQQGSWEGEQLIQAATLQRSITPVIKGNGPSKGMYGWHWWISSFLAGEDRPKEVPYHFALGFGGQYIIIVPSHGLVVVITADRNTKKRNPPVEVFKEYIVPILVNSTTS
jgi:CubicO group peptidase (beta-lactamase class C family)